VDGVKARAKIKGMAPSRWLASLTQSNLMRHPVMTDDELTTLRATNRELAAISRNINQIARALNNHLYETERVKIEKLEELRQLIIANRDAIHALVRMSQQSWKADVEVVG